MKATFALVGVAIGLIAAIAFAYIFVSKKARDQEIALTGVASFCQNHVTYYQFSTGVAVGYNPDGTLLRC